MCACLGYGGGFALACVALRGMLWGMSQKRLPAVPNLRTLHQRPSWVSWSGRIDRSACAEVRVGEVRAQMEALEPVRSLSSDCEARGRVVMHARWLWMLHQKRKPREIQGDYRWKSHAMQPVRGWDRDKRWKRSLKDLAGPDMGPERSKILLANPNRGACQEKMLGLAADWEQELTVEHWFVAKVSDEAYVLPNLREKWDRRIRRYFLMCPGKALGYRSVPVWRPDARRVTPTERQKWWWAIGREAWGEPCTGKCYKLFLPLCTPQELDDSMIALEWLKMVDQLRRAGRLSAAATEDEQVVAARYGPLLPPRRLVCGKCLGLHYGKAKKMMERWRASTKHVTGLGVGERYIRPGAMGRAAKGRES